MAEYVGKEQLIEKGHPCNPCKPTQPECGNCEFMKTTPGRNRFLYHVTSPENVESIIKTGLKRSVKGRSTFCVYLSEGPVSWYQAGLDILRVDIQGLDLLPMHTFLPESDEIMVFDDIPPYIEEDGKIRPRIELVTEIYVKKENKEGLSPEASHVEQKEKNIAVCEECETPHNKYTGCPMLGGLIPTKNTICPREHGTGGVTGTEIRETPAADVVEVVRCKDCKHRPIYDESSFLGPILAPEIDVGTDIEQDYTCPYLCSDPFYSAIPQDDFYCAKGERKNEM